MRLIQLVDSQTTHFLYTLIPHNSFFDGFFSVFSFLGGSVYPWVICIVILAISIEKHRNHRFFLTFIGCIGLIYLVSDFILKLIFQRSRPFVILNSITPLSCPSDFSFPSSHAGVAFGAALILSRVDKKRSLLYYCLAIIISCSRIYLGCHYLGDVLAGAVIGSVIASLFVRLSHTSSKK